MRGAFEAGPVAADTRNVPDLSDSLEIINQAHSALDILLSSLVHKLLPLRQTVGTQWPCCHPGPQFKTPVKPRFVQSWSCLLLSSVTHFCLQQALLYAVVLRMMPTDFSFSGIPLRNRHSCPSLGTRATLVKAFPLKAKEPWELYP